MDIGGVRVVHALPGRIRLKIGQLQQNPALAGELRTQLAGIPGVRLVEVNPVTGSVLVLFEPPEGAPADSIRFLSTAWPARFGKLDVQAVEAGLGGGGNGAGGTPSMDRRIVDFFGALNAGVARTTSGVDLKVLLPLVLFFLGLRSLLFSDKVPFPTWYDFFWFALSTFVMLNGSALETAAEAQPRLGSVS